MKADSFDDIAEDLVLHITPWERAALQFLSEGTVPDALAHRLGTTERDVEERLTNLFARMGVVGHGQAVADALRRGLLSAAPRQRIA
jgi:DNA-binding NarL/FixJ family response regulator